jgi:hypothetical protein
MGGGADALSEFEVNERRFRWTPRHANSYQSSVNATSPGPDDLVHRVMSAVRPRLHPEVDPRVLEDTARRVVFELSDGARVVDFVPVLAEHRVREELRG